VGVSRLDPYFCHSSLYVLGNEMNPTEFETPEGRARFMILQTMCRAVASKSGWIGVLSNWALGTTAAYVSLMLANLHEIQNHLHGTWIGPVFWLAVLSTVVGISIQFTTGWIQIMIEVENQIASVALDVLQNPGRYQLFPSQTMPPDSDRTSSIL